MTQLVLLQHHSFLPIFGVPIPLSTEGWWDSGIKQQIGEGKIYAVYSENLEQFYFFLVPEKSYSWIATDSQEGLAIKIFHWMEEILSESAIPKVTFFSEYLGPSGSDQVNFQTAEFWKQVRTFVQETIIALEKC